MIDWANLAANALWILGCALALATLSYASWQASFYQEKLRQRLGKPGIQVALSAAGVLFCAGLAFTSASTLQMILWALLGVLFTAQLVMTILQERKEHSSS